MDDDECGDAWMNMNSHYIKYGNGNGNGKKQNIIWQESVVHVMSMWLP